MKDFRSFKKIRENNSKFVELRNLIDSKYNLLRINDNKLGENDPNKIKNFHWFNFNFGKTFDVKRIVSYEFVSPDKIDSKDIRDLGFKFKNYKYGLFKGMKIYRCELK